MRGLLLGKEIEVFFCNFNGYGIMGIIISALLISIITYKIFKICKKNNLENYEQFLNEIIKEKNGYSSRANKQKIIKMSIKNIINIFLLISYFIMVAGFGSYFSQEFGISEIYGALIIAVLCYYTFNGNINGVTKINLILVPLLILVILFFGIKFELGEPVNITRNADISWLSSAVLYASYNSILLIPILISLSNKVKNRNKNIVISLIAFVIIVILSYIIYSILMTYYSEISIKELPMLYIAGKKGSIYRYLYGIIILISIFTSAVSAGYGFLENIAKPKNYKKINLIICSLSVAVSKIGFSYMVNLLYPVFGFIGLLQIGIIMMYKNK